MPSASDAIRALQERASVGVGSRPDRDAERALAVLGVNELLPLVEFVEKYRDRHVPHCQCNEELCPAVNKVLARIRDRAQEALDAGS